MARGKSSNRAGSRPGGGRGRRKLGWVAVVLVALVLGWWSGGAVGWPDARNGRGELAAGEERALRAFIDHYFASWSRRDMSAYRDCFHPRATIHHVDPSGRVTMQRREDFVAGQRVGHARSPVPMVEVPLWQRIDAGPEVVQVHVGWRLSAGQREKLGRNHFTLRRTGDGFEILNLVFYGEETSADQD